MGIYMVRKDALSKIPKNEFYGFDRLMLDLLADEAPVSVKPHGGYWLDIGRPSDYETALEEINKLDFIG
jgi:NDP-sugar pyrophosphorylase family protein